MRRYALPGSVAAIAVALLALLTFGISNQGENTSIDASIARGAPPAVPNASMQMPLLGASGTQSVAGLRGKVVVVNLWASWCDPCRAEAPLLEREQRVLVQHGGTILGVAFEDNASSAATFMRQEHISYPVVRDVSESFTRGLGSDGIPETFIIDRAGRIVAVRRYQLVGDWLSRTVQRVLAEGT